MLNMVATNAIVSPGYDGNPAVRFHSGEKNFQAVNFRIGIRVYDSKAKDNHRWINFKVKGRGEICDRIKKMKLKEGSHINLVAQYDEETWEDKKTKEMRTSPVLILQTIEFCSNSGIQQKEEQTGAPPNQSSRANSDQPQGLGQGAAPESKPTSGAQQRPEPPFMPDNFTGYENYGGFGGGGNPYFP